MAGFLIPAAQTSTPCYSTHLKLRIVISLRVWGGVLNTFGEDVTPRAEDVTPRLGLPIAFKTQNTD